ncbi:hypothetical protein Tco_0428932 [Tanacetum coccineum]
MDDNRTMTQLLEAPTEGYEDAIVVPEITANNFEIKHGLLNLVQNKQFWTDKEPNAHIRIFQQRSLHVEVPNVPSSLLSYRFPIFPRGTGFGLKKNPLDAILTWDDLVSKS